MAAFALQVAGASRVYQRGGVACAAFEDLDLEVHGGEILALLGPSGCGKSTLLRALAGLEALDAGSVTFGDGLDREHAIGIAFQQPSLLPWLTVAGNIGLGLRFAVNRGSRSVDVVEDTIAELGLEAVADSFPDELSGGQAQRSNVARVVVTGRPILLMDEPFAALDPATRSDLQQWLIELCRSHDLTVIVVTHDVSEALLLGDRVALMSGAPGSIRRIWSVDRPPDATNDEQAVSALRREILAHYDSDRSPERPAMSAWPIGVDTTEFEGATR